MSGSLSGNFDINSPTVIWGVVVVSHEIGHNVGSQHTHCYEGMLDEADSVDNCYGSELEMKAKASSDGPSRIPPRNV